MKLIAGALITAVLLSGCSEQTANNSAEIDQAKIEACKLVNDFKLSSTSLKVTEPIALAFNKLASLDSNYSDVAEAAYYAFSIDKNLYPSTSSQILMADYIKSTSKILRFCLSD